jgi:uncharacterized protein YceK
MKQVSYAVAIFVGVALVLSGCCSIMHGTRQEIGVSSYPTGARVFVNGSQVGMTPATLELKRNASQRIRLELDGYQPYEMSLTKSTSGWVWGNIIFGGIIGLAVDAIDGALYKLSPEQISAQLSRGEGDTFQVKMVNGIPDNAEKVGQMEKTTAEKLKELKDLKDSGILTDDEYETKRKVLVEELGK